MTFQIIVVSVVCKCVYVFVSIITLFENRLEEIICLTKIISYQNISPHSTSNQMERMDNVFQFEEGMEGFCSNEDWPYVKHRHWFQCNHNKGLCNPVSHTKLSSFVDITNSTSSLMKTISIQPVAVAIDASSPSFQLYKESYIM